MLNFYGNNKRNRSDFKRADASIWHQYDLSALFHHAHFDEWEALYKQNADLARQFIQAQTLKYIASNPRLNRPRAAVRYDESLLDLIPMPLEPNPRPCQIAVKPVDCLYAAQELVNQGKKVAVLNMANQFGAGGGYLHGAGAQEEDLCRRSNLIDTLDLQLYENDSTDPENKGFGEFGTLYSEKVTVFRQAKDKNYAYLSPSEEFQVSVVSSAAYDLRHSFSVDTKSERYRQGMKQKIIMQLEVAIKHGHKNLVLSAFGCGAFLNNPVFVSELYKEVLSYKRYQHAFESVVFAIVPNPGYHNDNFTPFHNTFVGKSSQPSLVDMSQFKQEATHSPYRFALRIALSAGAAIAFYVALPQMALFSVPLFLSSVALSYKVVPFAQQGTTPVTKPKDTPLPKPDTKAMKPSISFTPGMAAKSSTRPEERAQQQRKSTRRRSGKANVSMH